MANVNIRVDDAVKVEAEKIFAELGLSMSAATNVFYRQVIRHGGIPFDLRITDPFYSPANQSRLLETIRKYEAGLSKPVVKSIAELEEMSNE